MPKTLRSHDYQPLTGGFGFAESPRWHDGQLWISDFFQRRVATVDMDGTIRTVLETPWSPSGLGFLGDGSFLVVAQEKRCVYQVQPSGAMTVYADFSGVATGLGNDMLVTGSGHAYVGNFGFKIGIEEPRPTSLTHIPPTREVFRVADPVVFPNGTVVTPDGTLLVAETMAHRISAFDLAADGTPLHRRDWAILPEHMRPDGITLDSDGGIWFAHAMTAAADSGVYRVVEGGDITDWVPTKGIWAVACVFGGPALDRLLLVCNQTTMKDFYSGVSAGRILAADVGRLGVADSQ